jgi:sulfane dehydrogenase subunit SoxC
MVGSVRLSLGEAGMSLEKDPKPSSQRGLLRAAGGGAASLASTGGIAQAAGNAENQTPNMPKWSRSLGPGVIEETYASRSRHETGSAPLCALADA